MRSFRAAQSELDYLGHARPADWTTRVNDAISMAGSELNGLERWIRGKTGNPEAEQRLAALWGDVFRLARAMQDNAPSVARQLADRAELFLTDFWTGVKEANDGYIRWTMEHSGPLLQQYHDAVNRHYQSKNDLKRLQARGVSSAALEQAVAETEANLSRIRSFFNSIGGVSIDNIAQEQHGKYVTLEAVVAVVAAVAIVAVAGLIATVWYAAKRAEELIAKAKAAAGETIKEAEAAAGRTTAAGAAAGGAIASQATGALTTILIGGGVIATAAVVAIYFIRKKK